MWSVRSLPDVSYVHKQNMHFGMFFLKIPAKFLKYISLSASIPLALLVSRFSGQFRLIIASYSASILVSPVLLMLFLLFL